ncbi:MAG TPA: DNA-primase RepB domain-containing protein [Vicinamibacterales bacterium]|nr:DNA-primase RepB domain-containing protein [Vicinamibacterales bacterium]
MLEVRNEAAQFLRTCFRDDDWTALLLKNADAGKALQRTASLAWACKDSVLDWLRTQNAARCDVYVGVSAVAVGARSRARRHVTTIRHVFLDVDRGSRTVLRRLELRSDLPQPNYIVHTSPDRVHLLWRVRRFEAGTAERLQKRLAADLNGDLAATSITQMTRLPGFWNHKYSDPYRVWVDYRDVSRVLTPEDFPYVEPGEPLSHEPVVRGGVGHGHRASTERALTYLSRVPAAVAGHHGDLHTFRTCCRIVRGFALDDDALAVLAEWNARCQPPWTERELREKIRSARRNGREPIGGLL